MRAEFTDKQPKYKYIRLDDDNADVIILDFIEEITIENQSPIYHEIDETVPNEELVPILSPDETEQLETDSELIGDADPNNDITETVEPEIQYETTTQTMYVYEMHSFRCDPKEITEEMISANPETYRNYKKVELTTEEIQNDINIDFDYRLSMIELGLI